MPRAGRVEKKPGVAAGLGFGLVFALVLCGGLYACSVPVKREASSFLEKASVNGQAPYALDPTDAADAERTVAALKGNTGLWLFNFHERSGSNTPTRACLFGRVSHPSGGRWIDIALEKVGGDWRVRDLSFDRDCASGKHGDLKLRP